MNFVRATFAKMTLSSRTLENSGSHKIFRFGTWLQPMLHCPAEAKTKGSGYPSKLAARSRKPLQLQLHQISRHPDIQICSYSDIQMSRYPDI